MSIFSQQDTPDLYPIPRSEAVGRCLLNLPDFVWCLMLFAFALAIRVVYLSFAGIPSQAGLDAEGYIALARNLAEGYGFTIDGVPYTYRPPLFSWFLGIWCYLWGNTSLAAMVAFQVLVQAISAPLTYIFIQLISPRKPFALAGGLFISAYPFIFSSVGYILQEPVQMFIGIATAIAVVVWCLKLTFLYAITVGLLFGLSALAKAPNLIAPFIILLIWLFGRDFRQQLPIRQVLLIGIVMIAIVSPWTIRNYFVSNGRFILVNSQDVGLLTWLVADGNFKVRKSLSDPPQDNPLSQNEGLIFSYGNLDGIKYLTLINSDLLGRGISGPALEDGLRTASIKYLLSHPKYMFKLTIRGMLLLISPYVQTLFGKSITVRVLAMILFHLPLFIGFILGICIALIQKNAALVIISLYALAYLLIHAPGSISGGRFTIPVIPILIFMTVYSIEWYIKRNERQLS